MYMNRIELKFSATLENEVVIRNTIGLFVSTLNCTIEDIIDVKTIVSEAVSNAIIHGYEQEILNQFQIVLLLLKILLVSYIFLLLNIFLL